MQDSSIYAVRIPNRYRNATIVNTWAMSSCQCNERQYNSDSCTYYITPWPPSVYILHALIQRPINRHTQAQTNSDGASLLMFHINLHSVTITSDISKQNSDKHILSVLQPFTQHTIAQSLQQWLSYDLNDRGIMVRFPVGIRDFPLFSENPRLALGPIEGPLRLSCALSITFPQLFSLRATCFARLILFILSFPLWPKNRCVRCGVIKSSRQVPPATTHLLLERRQLLQYGSLPPAEPACTCTSVSCSHHHCRHKHIPGRSTAIWHPAVSLLDKKFAAFYRTRNVHYRAHKSTPPVPIPCQKNPSMTFLCTPLRPASALSTHLCLVPIIQAFPPKPCTHFSSLPTRATCRAHHIFLDIIVSHPTINHEK